MQNTYENLRDLAKLYNGSTNFEDLAFEYQIAEGENPLVFSVAYCKLYPFIITQAEKYYELTESDKSSFSLEEMHKTLLDFDPDKGAKCMTLYSRYLNNRLKVETQLVNKVKRKANIGAVMKTEYLDLRTVYPDEYREVEMLEALAPFNLTPNEKKFCQLVMTDSEYIQGTDIAEHLGITPAGVTWIKSSLKRKLGGSFLVAFS